MAANTCPRCASGSDEIGRDGRQMADVVVGGQREAAFDHGLAHVGEPLGALQLGARPLHLRLRRGAVGRGTSCLSTNGDRAAQTASATRRVGQLYGAAERGEHPAGLHHRGQPRPPVVRFGPVERGGGVDQVVPPGRPQLLEGGLDGGDVVGDVFAQLGEHGGVGVGRGHGDSPLGEQAGGLAGSGADLEGGPDRAGGVVRHHVEDVHGVARTGTVRRLARWLRSSGNEQTCRSC